jgi:hypothetical protein
MMNTFYTRFQARVAALAADPKTTLAAALLRLVDDCHGGIYKIAPVKGAEHIIMIGQNKLAGEMEAFPHCATAVVATDSRGQYIDLAIYDEPGRVIADRIRSGESTDALYVRLPLRSGWDKQAWWMIQREREKMISLAWEDQVG